MSRYNLHSISQVGADVWHEMYEGVHGNGKSPADWNPEYFSITPDAYFHRSVSWRPVTDFIQGPACADMGYLLPQVNHKHRDDFEEEGRKPKKNRLPKAEMLAYNKRVREIKQEPTQEERDAIQAAKEDAIRITAAGDLAFRRYLGEDV